MVDNQQQFPKEEWKAWANQTLTRSCIQRYRTWREELLEDSLNMELTVENIATIRGKIAAIDEIVLSIEEMRKETE